MKNRYKVISAGTSDGLAREVDKALKEGYIPIGGVAVAQDPDPDNGFWFYQAVWR